MFFLRSFIVITLLFFSLVGRTQTLGTINLDYSKTSEGYTLFGTTGQPNSYLIDNCGRIINEWSDTIDIGTALYLDKTGNLIKTGKDDITPPINGGGSYDRVLTYDWQGNLLWNYQYSNTAFRAHHDVQRLPNGNLLILAWETKSKIECFNLGKDTTQMTEDFILSETIIEVEQTGLTTGNIIWKWDVFDHLVQDFNNTLSNFGIVPESPELMNINTVGSQANALNADWLHANSLFYFEEFDQIVISFRKISEVVIIDHSTSASEVTGHTGGTYGKGGDFLYRFGNPLNYDLGNSSLKILHTQHDAKVFSSNGNHYLSVFNNGNDRPTQFSTVDLLELPVNVDGSYSVTSNVPFGPSTFYYTYSSSPSTDFFAIRTSGAHILPNGNLMVCNGPKGYFMEIDTSDNSIVWKYNNPVDQNGPNSDGIDPNTIQNNLFKTNKYDPSFDGFSGKNMSPGGYVELNSSNNCSLSLIEETNTELSLYPNPFSNYIRISDITAPFDYSIYDFTSRLILKGHSTSSKIDLSNLKPGTYFIKINTSSQRIMKF